MEDKKNDFNIEDIKTYSEKSKSTEWLIEDWIEKNTIAFMYGKSNQYKSYVALTIAYHLATGKKLDHFDVNANHQRVLFVATEGLNTLANRYKALEQTYGEVPSKTFGLYTGKTFCWEDEYINEFIKTIRPSEFGLVIIDSLSASLTNETLNSDSVVRNVISQIKKIRDKAKTTVLVVAHTGKNVSKGMMGSAVLRNDVDTEIKVDGVKKLITLTKQRNGSKDNMVLKFMPLPINLDNGSNLYLDFDSKNVGLDDEQRKILEAFKHLNQDRVQKKELKKAFENILYPSGIVPRSERDNLRTKFNRKTNSLVCSHIFYETKIDKDIWYSEQPFDK